MWARIIGKRSPSASTMRAGDARQLGRQFDRGGRRDATAARSVVEPVDAKEVERVGRVGIDGAEALGDRRRDGRGVLQFAEGRQDDPGLAEAGERPLVDVAVDQMRFQSEPRHSTFPSHSRQAAGQDPAW